MSPALSLCPIRPEDLPELHRIRSLAFAPIFASFRSLVGDEIASIALDHAEEEQAAHLDEICAAGSRHCVLAVVEKNEIIGFVSFSVDAQKRSGELGLNAVAPAHSSRGVGSWMFQEALRRMKEMGAEVVEVGTGGDEAHAPARRAYEKAGFHRSIPSLHLYRKL